MTRTHRAPAYRALSLGLLCASMLVPNGVVSATSSATLGSTAILRDGGPTPRSSPAGLPPQYGITPITSRGASVIQVRGLNDSGDVVGDALFPGNHDDGFRWRAGSMMELQPIARPGTTPYTSAALGINDSGKVVGWSTFATGGCCSNPQAAAWPQPSFAPQGLGFLRDFGTAADPHYWSQSAGLGINNAGDVAGWSVVGAWVTDDNTQAVGPVDAFLKPPGGSLQDIANPCPCPKPSHFSNQDIGQYFALGLAVNDKRQVLIEIHRETKKGIFEWVELWQDGNTDRMPFRVAQYGPHPLNDGGVVVGTLRPAETRPNGKPYCLGISTCLRGQAAYDYSGMTPVPLTPLPGFSYGSAYGIDDNGDIVGSSNDPVTGNTVATLWPHAVAPAGSPSTAQPININSLVPADSGIYLRYGWLINNKGQIVAGARKRITGIRQMVFLGGAGPRITRIYPPAGPIAGGNIVTVSGSGLDKVDAVCFKHRQGSLPDTCPAPLSGATNASLQVQAPSDVPGAPNPDVVDIQVHTHFQQSDDRYSPVDPTQDAYMYGLQVTRVSPGSRPIFGGRDRTVIISGFGFLSRGKPTVDKVSFMPVDGDPAVVAKSFTVNSSIQITTTAPTPSLDLLKSQDGLITDVVASGPSGTSVTSKAALFTFLAPNMVQLGDSVASGEGTLYGYHYDKQARKWVGGSLNATWPPPNPACHDSPDAYGERVSADIHATFLQLACTGASFSNGIATENRDPDTHNPRGPAQFGNWLTKTGLNSRYDSAKPDIVLVTLGADDVNFTQIVSECVKNALLPHLKLECTAENPGPTVQRDFFRTLPVLRANLALLTGWIRARGDAAKNIPTVVFTNYYDPLPANGGTCPGTWSLHPKQLEYLDTLLRQLDQSIAGVIRHRQSKDLAFVDLSGAFTGHAWCSADPWAYDLSMDSVSNTKSQAPFHPTPMGQKVIARLVEAEVRRLLANQGS